TQVGRGDGVQALPDPADPRHVLALGSAGRLVRVDMVTGERRNVRPWAPDDQPLRFAEAPPLAADPYDAGALYLGSQFVHKSPDGGESWQIISPDLTGGGPAPGTRGSGSGAGP